MEFTSKTQQVKRKRPERRASQKREQDKSLPKAVPVQPRPGKDTGLRLHRPHAARGGYSRRAALAAHLVVVEDGIRHGVLPWHRGGPQLLHEEHLVGERGHDSCGRGQPGCRPKVPGQDVPIPSTSPRGDPLGMTLSQPPPCSGPRMHPGPSLTLPSLTGRAFFIQSVRCRTKSKKKSFSGTLMT